MRRVIGCVILGALLPALAAAQTNSDDGLGVRAGSFIFSPSISAGTIYDTNIFRDNINQQESFRVIVAPRLEIESDWNRHAVRLDTGVEYGYYSHSSSDQYVDYDVTLTGELDITRSARLSGSMSYFHAHEARGEDDVAGNAAEPVTFDGFSIDLQGDVAFNFLQISPFAAFQYLDFDNNPLIGGGFDNQNDRDRTDIEAGLELAYVVRRGYDAFVRGSYLQTDYTDAVDDTGVNRDSDRWRMLGGLRVDLTRLLEGSVGVGYISRNYDDPLLIDVNGFTMDGDLTWTPTRPLSFTWAGSRDIREATQVGTSGVTTTLSDLTATYELLRNLSLNSSFSYANLIFDGTTRTDHIYTFGFGAAWSVNRNFTVQPNYQFETRNSSDPGLGFFAHQVSLTGQYDF